MSQELAESPQKEMLDRTFNEIKDAQERSSQMIYAPKPTLLERFDEEFVRDDGLMDKYIYVKDETNETGVRVDTTANAIKSFISRNCLSREEVGERVRGTQEEIAMETTDLCENSQEFRAKVLTKLSDVLKALHIT